MTPADLETLRGQINLRFQSGNSIQVSDVRLARAEWEALTALLSVYEQMRECATSYIEALDRCEISGNDGADVYEADQALAALRATLKENEHE